MVRTVTIMLFGAGIGTAVGIHIESLPIIISTAVVSSLLISFVCREYLDIWKWYHLQVIGPRN